MSKMRFNFQSFLSEKRLDLVEVATQLNMSYQSLYLMQNRGTVKNSFIRKLENAFGNIDKYINNSSKKLKAS